MLQHHDRPSHPVLNALDRIDADLDVQSTRLGLIQGWLNDHAERLERLESRIAESTARLERMLASARG